MVYLQSLPAFDGPFDIDRRCVLLPPRPLRHLGPWVTACTGLATFTCAAPPASPGHIVELYDDFPSSFLLRVAVDLAWLDDGPAPRGK